MNNDTIVATSTSTSGAIAIVRLSGAEAITITNKMFKGCDLTKVPTHTIHYGHIVSDEEVIDEVLISIFLSPRTYTKEDVVEINCHGGNFITKRIVEEAIKNGARLSEAGEFTKRAFLNGRIDLTQAEAVMDMINAQTKEALRIANRGLNGGIKKLIQELRSYLINVLAKIEVNIDYPEYEDEEQITSSVIEPILTDVINHITKIITESEKVLQIKNGIKTALIGKPNVGKSSLLNALIKEEKAIVTDIAGTTRDIVEGQINLDGLRLNLIDTAGLHEAKDEVEKIGIIKTKQVIDDADLVLLVFDNHQSLTKEDIEILELTKEKRRLIIINKSDLETHIALDSFDDYILISAYQHQDIEKLETKIKDAISYTPLDDNWQYLASARQVAKLSEAKKSINDALASVRKGYPIDIASLDIHHGWEALGEIIGDVNNDDLYDELFSKFCLGK